MRFVQVTDRELQRREKILDVEHKSRDYNGTVSFSEGRWTISSVINTIQFNTDTINRISRFSSKQFVTNQIDGV